MPGSQLLVDRASCSADEYLSLGADNLEHRTHVVQSPLPSGSWRRHRLPDFRLSKKIHLGTDQVTNISSLFL